MPRKIANERERRINFRISMTRANLDALDKLVEELNEGSLGKFDRSTVLEGLFERTQQEK